ncbi:MAG: hypothetical protein MUP20_01385, partial [Methyloceanibacter sp.]|nr:hypothetical protein [Methyloceanibacter sp.]
TLRLWRRLWLNVLKRRLRLMWLNVLMQRLRLRLWLLRLRVLMRSLRLWLDVLMRLVDRLGHRLVRLRPLARCRRVDPAELELHQPVHRLELGPEVLQPCVMLVFQLLDELVELRFLGTDLLSQESGPVLQVPANVTHCCPSFMVLAPTTRRGWQGSRKTERTLPGHRAGQVMQGPGIASAGDPRCRNLSTWNGRCLG